MIEVNNLMKKYDKFAAIESFDLIIPTGSIFGLVGINGAGKSTFLRVLAGIFRADAGSVKIDGEEIFENEKKKREILYLPDEPFSTPLMNGKDIITRYKAFYNVDDNALKLYINEFRLNLATPIRNFSKGMKRQLFVSIALSCNPKYLFIDEVFDGLDPSARIVFKRGIKELTERVQCTVILASHSLKELEGVCDSYGVIDGKKILKSGDINDKKANIHKFNVAFKRPVKKEDLGFECTLFETSGQIARIVVRGEKQEILEKINKFKPLIVEETLLGLEEMFINDTQRRSPSEIPHEKIFDNIFRIPEQLNKSDEEGE